MSDLMLVAELTALGLAAWGAHKSLPKPPGFEWGQLFRLGIANSLRGEIEAREGSLEEWTAAVRRLVDSDAEAADLVRHPDDLGSAYALGPVLHPDVGWDAVATWTPAVQEVFGRRLAHLVVAVSQVDLADALCQQLPTLRVAPVADPTAAQLAAPLTSPSDRLVVLCGGDAAFSALQTLADEPALRDRLALWLSLGGKLRDTAARNEWVEANFRHDRMDTELQRTVPFLTVAVRKEEVATRSRESEAGAAGTASHPQHLPSPPENPTGLTSIQSAELGALPKDLAPHHLARAILLLLAHTST